MKNEGNRRILIICNLLFVVVTLIMGALYLRKASESTGIITNQVKYVSLAQKDLEQFETGTDYMTQQAKCYVVNGRVAHMFNYFKEINEIQNRERALEQLKNDNCAQDELDFMRLSYQKSNELMDCEIHAMKLITLANDARLENIPFEIKQYQLSGSELLLSKEAMEEKARELLYGRDYEAKKDDIARKIKMSSDLIMTRTQDDLRLQTAKLEVELYRIKLILVIAICLDLIFAALLLLCADGKEQAKKDVSVSPPKARKNSPPNKGFTLMEMLVVFVILVAIFGVIIPNYFKYVGKSRDVRNLEVATTYKKVVDHVMVDAVMGDLGEFELYEGQQYYQAYSTRIEEPQEGRHSKVVKSIAEQLVSGKDEFEVIARIEDYRVTQISYKDLNRSKVYVWYIDSPAGEKLQDESYLNKRDEWLTIDCEDPANWVSDYTMISDGNVCWNGYEKPEDHVKEL